MMPLWFASGATGGRRERRFYRFILTCPVSLKYHADNSAIEVQGVVQNVSIGGFLLKSAAMIPQHTVVTFIISLKGEAAARPIYLTGDGQIVRVENSQNNAICAIAVECRDPITQLEAYPRAI
jgi:PilZ domain